MMVLGGGAVSYEQGAHVRLCQFHTAGYERILGPLWTERQLLYSWKPPIVPPELPTAGFMDHPLPAY